MIEGIKLQNHKKRYFGIVNESKIKINQRIADNPGSIIKKQNATVKMKNENWMT